MRDGEDDMTMATINQLCGNRIGTVCLISCAAGITEARLAAERHIVEMVTMMAVIETVALFKVTAVKHFLDFILDNRADA